MASPLARRMAAQGNRVTNLRQEALYVSELGRQVVRRLDGLHDRRALLDALTQRIIRGELNAEKDGQPLAAGEALGNCYRRHWRASWRGLPTVRCWWALPGAMRKEC